MTPVELTAQLRQMVTTARSSPWPASAWSQSRCASPSKPVRDERLGPAEHPVDAVDEGLVARLDDAVAVEDEGVAAADGAGLARELGAAR